MTNQANQPTSQHSFGATLFPMDDRHHLHEHERLLAHMRPAGSFLILSLLAGLFDTLLFGVVFSVLLALGFWVSGLDLSAVLFVIVFAAVFVIVCLRRVFLWREAALRITTERILLEYPRSLFLREHHTVKWTQYQESHPAPRQFFDFFFRARTLNIRHGTADAQRENRYPSLRYAQDLKHYLDKVDSAVRAGKADELRPFVPKPRGQRDGVQE